MSRLRAWFDARTGIPSSLSAWFSEHIPGGPRWAYVFGSALLFLLLAQLGSGLGLALGYSPSVTTAWESVAQLQLTSLGRFLRALHAHGATALVLIALAHLLQTAVQGAYRAPRELTWWVGLIMLLILLAFTLTGTLLPWDERGYFATQVTLGIAGSAPLVGGLARRVLAGGDTLGNLTLTRFYAVHALLLPLLLLVLAAAHVASMRRHGLTPPPSLDRATRNQRTPFWPVQALYDAVFSLVLLAALLALALTVPADLGAPADPSASAAARPEWMFLPIFQLLKLVPGALEGVVALLLPLGALGLLFALPFLDRHKKPDETWTDRLPVALGLGGALLVAVALGLTAKVQDGRSAEFATQAQAARARAQIALTLAANGTPPQGALFQVRDQPHLRGERLFRSKCLACHRVGDEGTRFGPELTGYLSRDWIRGALTHPNEPQYWGKSDMVGMESFTQLGDTNLNTLVEFLYSLRTLPAGPEGLGPVHTSALKLFNQNCAECHTLQPNEKSPGPSLGRWGSDPWLRAVIHDAGVPFLYGLQNKMTAFGAELSPREVEDLISYLRTLETRAAPKLTAVVKAPHKK